MVEKAKFKKEKYQDKMLAGVNSFIRTQVSDSRLSFVSFTKVDLTQDYSQSTVFWDTYDPEKKEDIEKALDGIKGKLRSYLAKNLEVRHTPSIEFKYDAQYESEQKILDILDEESKLGKN